MPGGNSDDCYRGCWKLTLIQALIDSSVPLRYSELRDKAGEISDRTLTRSLRELEAVGIAKRWQPARPRRFRATRSNPAGMGAIISIYGTHVVGSKRSARYLQGEPGGC